MLYETLLSKLGARMSLNFRPQAGAVWYSPLGRYFDAPMDLRLGLKVGDQVRVLPFTHCVDSSAWEARRLGHPGCCADEDPAPACGDCCCAGEDWAPFSEIEQHLTMTGVLFRASWRELGLRLEVEFTSPFYPQNEQLSSAPVFFVRLALRSFGQGSFAGRPAEVEVLFEGDWDAAAAGAENLQTTVEGDLLRRSWVTDLGKTEIGELSFFAELPRATRRVACEDLRYGRGPGLQVGEDGFRFTLRPDGEEAEVIWVSYTPDPVLTVHGEETPFKYTQYFASAAEVLAWAAEHRAEILARTRFFDSLFAEASFTPAERDLHAFGFQSYLANTWWTRLPDGRDWYSVWEGCCLFHSTVDVEYNMATFYLLFWPQLLELELDAWARFTHPHPEIAGKYLNHDLGIRDTVGAQAYHHQMELEENCNYLLLLYALWRMTGDRAPVERNWAVARDLAEFLRAADLSGNGWPQVGVANTIDDASPAVQFAHEQTYMAVKTAASLRAVSRMGVELEDPDTVFACEVHLEKLDATLQAEAWLGDHYAVCIDKDLSQVTDAWDPGRQLTDVLTPEGRIVGWDAYSLYTSLGLLHLLMTDTELPVSDVGRLREDLRHAAEQSAGPYGCFHSSVDHSNEWVSMNLHRDCVAAYLGLDLITPLTGKYWNFELHTNSAHSRGGCFTDTYGGNFLHYYPRGLTSMGLLAALAGFKLDRVAGVLKLRPVRLPLYLPLVALADWEGLRVPWLRAQISEVGADVQVIGVDLIEDQGLEPDLE